MGMVLALYAIKDDAIDVIVKQPQLTDIYFAAEIPEDGLEEHVGCIGKLFGVKPKKVDLSNVPPCLLGTKPEDTDLDKAWHAIHFLLTGEEGAKDEKAAAADPRYWLLCAPTTVSYDMGYESAHVIRSEETKRFSAMLNEISEEELRRRYKPEEMDKLKIYPTIWVRDGEQGFQYIWEYFRILKDFTEKRVERGEGMLFALC